MVRFTVLNWMLGFEGWRSSSAGIGSSPHRRSGYVGMTWYMESFVESLVHLPYLWIVRSSRSESRLLLVFSILMNIVGESFIRSLMSAKQLEYRNPFLEESYVFSHRPHWTIYLRSSLQEGECSRWILIINWSDLDIEKSTCTNPLYETTTVRKTLLRSWILSELLLIAGEKVL